MKTLKELFDAYCDEMHTAYGKTIKEDSYTFLQEFIRFSTESCCTEWLCQEVVDDWCMRGAHESQKYYNIRVGSLRLFLTFANRNYEAGIILPEKLTVEHKPKRVTQRDKPFQKSPLSDYMEEYVRFLHSSGKYSNVVHDTLIAFNRKCAAMYGDVESIGRTEYDALMADTYKKGTSRSIEKILYITRFFEYTNFRGYTDLEMPDVPSFRYKHQRTPYPFSDDDLKMFFYELDRQTARKYEDDRSWKFRRLQESVVFRLLFSTGMRTNEVRELKRSNIDWDNGVIDIENTKGYHQHRVALHPSMQDMLKRYDTEMDVLMPNRTVFFPTPYDEVHKTAWLNKIFNAVWNKMSSADARPYDFRSNYAVRNINRWQQSEPNWIDRFVFLSRSMGHSSLDTTAYYYQLVPMFREKLESQTGKNLQRLMPDMDDFLDE